MEASMGSLITSTLITAASEMGDKSQLLALLLGLRFRKPLAIMLGILIATAMSNIMAALAGTMLASMVDPQLLRWIAGLLFLAMAIWAATPDKIGRDHILTIKGGGLLVAPGLSFFIAELCDKSQLATATLAAAQYDNILYVLIGTTLGMMLVNTPVVVFGVAAGQAVRLLPTRYVVGVLLAAVGFIVLVGGPPA
jgi:Ca2+/H+ antiporter, TMEM165/GDT1 family